MGFKSVCLNVWGAFAIAATLLIAASPSASAATPPGLQINRPSDSTSPPSLFYTVYQQLGENILWLTCGYDTESSGCYGSGTLGPFGRPCSFAGSSTRLIVADSNPQSGRTTLYFYKQVESSSPTSTLVKTLKLPGLPPSTTARCEMAVLGQYLYFGTTESPTYYQVDLKTYGITTGSACGGNTSAITANDNFVVVSMSGCFTGFDKEGRGMISGGEFGDQFVPGKNGFNPIR